ncbi:MAG TPA: type II secretion system F family protein [Nocardioidaceae bacterium]|nr:type II secretion system F family protein [Nocardioidaceae bacterium]
MPVTALAAAAGAAAAVWLLLPPSRRSAAAWSVRVAPSSRWSPGRSVVPAGLGAVAAGGMAVMVHGTTLLLGLIAVGGFVGAERIVRRGRDRRAAHQRADSVLEVCEALAAELRAGQPPLQALRRCVEVWPALEPVAVAAELGADVPRALRRLAALPGASGLAELASAWQVSERSGATMAVALGSVADSARRNRAAQHLVLSELASAQATARLLAALPAMVLVMGSGLGSDPWAFLLTTPIGLTCLGSGLLLTYGGLTWIDKIAMAAVER